jgi:hypothetical protein
MALNVRLPESLQGEARGYADGLGISLNALIAVALRDYLDARSGGVGEVAGEVRGEPDVPPFKREPGKVEAREDELLFFPGGNRRPCKCGSGKAWRNCHGKRWGRRRLGKLCAVELVGQLPVWAFERGQLWA